MTKLYGGSTGKGNGGVSTATSPYLNQAPRTLAEVEAEMGLRPNLVGAMLDAARQSTAALRTRISDVRYGDCENGEEAILFAFDGKPMRGVLRGRNRDLCIGFGEEADRAIALRVFLAGDSVEV